MSLPELPPLPEPDTFVELHKGLSNPAWFATRMQAYAIQYARLAIVDYERERWARAAIARVPLSEILAERVAPTAPVAVIVEEDGAELLMAGLNLLAGTLLYAHPPVQPTEPVAQKIDALAKKRDHAADVLNKPMLALSYQAEIDALLAAHPPVQPTEPRK